MPLTNLGRMTSCIHMWKKHRPILFLPIWKANPLSREAHLGRQTKLALVRLMSLAIRCQIRKSHLCCRWPLFLLGPGHIRPYQIPAEPTTHPSNIKISTQKKHVFFTRQLTHRGLLAPINHHGGSETLWWWCIARVTPRSGQRGLPARGITGYARHPNANPLATQRCDAEYA